MWVPIHSLISDQLWRQKSFQTIKTTFIIICLEWCFTALQLSPIWIQAIPHNQYRLIGFPPVIANILNKVIRNATRMLRRKLHISQLKMYGVSFHWADFFDNWVCTITLKVYKVGQAVSPMGLSPSISPTCLVWGYITWILSSQSCIMPDFGVPATGWESLGSQHQIASCISKQRKITYRSDGCCYHVYSLTDKYRTVFQ